jgi:hypothetical protein
MDQSVIVGLLSLVGTLAGTFGGILTGSRLTNYRLAQLEDKVARHNSLVERTYKIEETLALHEQKLESLERRQDA